MSDHGDPRVKGHEQAMECAIKLVEITRHYPPSVVCKALEGCLAAEIKSGYGEAIQALFRAHIDKFHEEWKTLSPSTDEIQ